MFSFTFDLTPAARNTIQKFSDAAKNVVAAKEALTEDLARTTADTIRKRLLAGEFDLPALSPAYGARKAAIVGDKPPLVFSGAYANSFQPVRLGLGLWGVVGPLPLAMYHEFGTKTSPARPHIRPALDELRKRQDIKDIFLRRLFGVEIQDGMIANRG